MKTQKLIVIAAIVCLLVGASGAAMAVNDCRDGFVTGVVNEDVIVNDTACVIKKADITGDIQITGAPNVTIFATKTSGKIVVQDSGVVALVGVTTPKNIRVRRNDVALVVGTVTLRKLVVNRNTYAGVKQNGALIAIICKGNDELDERFNSTEGEDECGK
jgi:hypothetical protein